jgi:hypothetical protein
MKELSLTARGTQKLSANALAVTGINNAEDEKINYR